MLEHNEFEELFKNSHFKSKTKFAEKINISLASLSAWKQKNKYPAYLKAIFKWAELANKYDNLKLTEQNDEHKKHKEKTINEQLTYSEFEELIKSSPFKSKADFGRKLEILGNAMTGWKERNICPIYLRAIFKWAKLAEEYDKLKIKDF